MTAVQNVFGELFLNTIQALVGGRTIFCRSPVVFLWLLHRLCSQVLRSPDRANTVRRVEAQVSCRFSAPHVATILDDPKHLEAFSRSPAFEQVLHTTGDCPIARSTRFGDHSSPPSLCTSAHPLGSCENMPHCQQLARSVDGTKSVTKCFCGSLGLKPIGGPGAQSAVIALWHRLSLDVERPRVFLDMLTVAQCDQAVTPIKVLSCLMCTPSPWPTEASWVLDSVGRVQIKGVKIDTGGVICFAPAKHVCIPSSPASPMHGSY